MVEMVEVVTTGADEQPWCMLDELLEGGRTAFTKAALQVVYTVAAVDADGRPLDLGADEHRALRLVISRGIANMSRTSGQSSLTESFASALIHSINANIHRVGAGRFRRDGLDRRTRALLDVDWLDDGAVVVGIHTGVNAVLLTVVDAHAFGEAVHAAIAAYRGKGAPIVKNAVAHAYRAALLEGDGLPEGVSFKIRFAHTEGVCLSTALGELTVDAVRGVFDHR